MSETVSRWYIDSRHMELNCRISACTTYQIYNKSNIDRRGIEVGVCMYNSVDLHTVIRCAYVILLVMY